MSLTIADILNLPSFRNSQLLAGKRNIGRMVTSVSVLEYSIPNEIIEGFVENNRAAGSEVILTAFSSVKDDIDQQCKIIRQMALYGEVAIFIYYVGIILPYIDERIIKTAEDVGIVLVCMEKNNLSLRYSDGITDIMEQVIAHRNLSNFEGEMLTQVSLLPENQRTIQSVLSLLRNKIKATLIISDLRDSKLLNLVASPESFENEIFSEIEKSTIPLSWWSRDFKLKSTEGPKMKLSIIRVDGTPLGEDICIAVQNVIQLFLNIWNPGHGQMIISEMIRAILKDEPVKIKRLGELFNIDVSTINEMWIIPQSNSDIRSKDKIYVGKCLQEAYRQVICDDFEDYIIAFTNGDCLSQRSNVAKQIRKEIKTNCICCARNLIDSNMVRKVYLHYCNYLNSALLIFPKADIYYLSYIDFAKEVSTVLDNHHSVSLRLRKINALLDNNVLLKTLAVYMLDCNQDIQQTAKMLSVHPNTLKYRLKQAEEKLCIDINNRFERLSIAKAIAVYRLLENQKKLL